MGNSPEREELPEGEVSSAGTLLPRAEIEAMVAERVSQEGLLPG